MKKTVSILCVSIFAIVAFAGYIGFAEDGFGENGNSNSSEVASQNTENSGNAVPELQTYDYTKSIDMSKVNREGFGEPDMEIGPQNYRDFFFHSPYYDGPADVIVATVVSKDGASALNDKGDYMFSPRTYGKMIIHETVLGDEKPGQIQFKRSGGFIKVKDSYEAHDDMGDKLNYLKKKAGQPTLQEDESFTGGFFPGDFDLEAGKTYMFLGNYIKDKGYFYIYGWQYGALAIETPQGPVTYKSVEGSDKSKWVLKNLSELPVETRNGAQKEIPFTEFYNQYIKEFIK